MITVNNVKVPTCSELADILKPFGDRPLFSGNGWVAVSGFNIAAYGMQVAVRRCPKDNEDPYTPREESL